MEEQSLYDTEAEFVFKVDCYKFGMLVGIHLVPVKKNFNIHKMK